MAGSGKTAWIVSLRATAESRSCPNGFSTMIRAPAAHPDASRWPTTSANNEGGTAR